jgi:general secretion pathway protein D
MGTGQRLITSCERAVFVTLALLAANVLAGDKDASPSRLAQGELARRQQNISEAQELLGKGDDAYKAGRYADAVAAFSGAHDMIPVSPVTAELRCAARDRLALASVQRAREQARQGDVAGGKKTLADIMTPELAGDDPAVIDAAAQLDDPIRTNPSLTKEHAKQVDEVRRLLYKADGFFELAEYDKAVQSCKDVLRVDPTNKAARRMMERAARAKSDYALSGYDEARATMLANVDAQWETPVAPDPGTMPDLEMSGVIASARETTLHKLRTLTLKRVDFNQVTLTEAVDYLRQQSVELDTLEPDPARKGINITVNVGSPDSEKAATILGSKIDLKLNNVPMERVLFYLCEATHTEYSTDDYAVTVHPVGGDATQIVTRSFRVPPDFLTNSGTEQAAAAPEQQDPFGAKPAGGGDGLLARRRSALDVLKAQGIPFPEGTGANFNPNTGTLVVRNTQANIDLISEIVSAISNTEPIEVVVRVTMISVEENRLKELGFDWLLSDFSLGGRGIVPGTAATYLSGGTRGTGSDLTDIPAADPSVLFRDPVTAGHRRGDEAVAPNSIDEMIASHSTGQASVSNRAPGIMTVSGLLSGSSVQMMMRGLDRKKGVDVMYAPSTVTRSGQSSSIHIIREFRYPSAYEPPQLPNSVGFGGGSPVTPAMPSAFVMKEVGVVLEVLPTVGADRKYIEVTLNPSITDFDGFVNYGSPINAQADNSFLGVSSDATGTRRVTDNKILLPIFSVKRANTSLTVADGATVVIGGLFQDKITHVEDKTPVFGQLPLVGRLFQSSVQSPVSKAVVFLVNVQLMDPTGHAIRDRADH